jgi:hypothetical protein
VGVENSRRIGAPIYLILHRIYKDGTRGESGSPDFWGGWGLGVAFSGLAWFGGFLGLWVFESWVLGLGWVGGKL